jgi:hypothetical protein
MQTKIHIGSGKTLRDSWIYFLFRKFRQKILSKMKGEIIFQPAFDLLVHSIFEIHLRLNITALHFPRILLGLNASIPM